MNGKKYVDRDELLEYLQASENCAREFHEPEAARAYKDAAEYVRKHMTAVEISYICAKACEKEDENRA